MKIVVERRSNHYHAAFVRDRGRWADGKTADEAIGKLVRLYGDALGIPVECIGEPVEPDVVVV